MEANKQIKIYGTLVNHTLDTALSDNTHNDALAYARQLYDDKFGATPNSANFQDVINKRLTAISYANGVTTINGDLVVTGDCSLNGTALNVLSLVNKINELQLTIIAMDRRIDELEHAVGNLDSGSGSLINRINIIENKVDAVEQLWSTSQDGTHIVSSKPAHAPGFYDTSIS